MPNNQQVNIGDQIREEPLTESQVLDRIERSSAEAPPSTDPEAVAEWIAMQHFGTSPEITDIYYLPTYSPRNEIRLLEVSRLVGRSQDEVEAVDFGFDVQGLDYRLLVADLSPREHGKLRSNEAPLPNGWVLNGARHWSRR